MSDDIQAQKDAITEAYESVQKGVTLSDILETISETSTEIAGLPGKIQALRDRGYAFAGYLEGKAKILADQWETVEADARRLAREKSAALSDDLDDVNEKYTAMQAANGMAAQAYIGQVEPVLERLTGEIEAAEEQVTSSFGKVPDNVQQTLRQINDITGYLDLAESASFPLNAAEAIFMAVNAEWEQTGKDKHDPDGIFYITDQRVVMEQKEKVGKGFLGRGGEMKQEVLWEASIGSLEQVAHENKGLMGGIDLIHMNFGAGAPFAKTTIEVKKGVKAEWFAAQLKRAATGGLEKERGLEVDEELVEAIANAPTTCGVCGATFEDPIVAGMTQIKCKYCGSVTRLAL